MIWLVEIRRQDGTVDPNESGYIAVPDGTDPAPMVDELLRRAVEGGADVSHAQLGRDVGEPGWHADWVKTHIGRQVAAR